MITAVETRLAMLRTVPGLQDLDDDDLAVLAREMHEASLPAGALLTREGHLEHECFLIIAGRAVVTVRDEPINTVGPGEFIGEMGVLDRQPRSATVRALTPMQLLAVDVEGLTNVLQRPPVARMVLSRLAERLRQARGYGTPVADGPDDH
jgi:CRP-like cAMP-binding protein